MKKFCAAMVLGIALTAVVMATAQAAVIKDFGTLNFGGSGLLARTPSGNVPPGNFDDDYRFKVASSAAGTAFVASIETDGRDITGLKLALFEAPSNSIVSDTGSSYLEVAASSLSAGVQYFVRVSGNANGSAGGKYAGGLSIVPVPAALPLMLGALAGLALIARRKTDA